MTAAVQKGKFLMAKRMKIYFLFAKIFKEVAKLHIMHSFSVVIVLFNTDLCKSAFSASSFRNLVLCLSVFFVFAYSVLNSMSSLETFYATFV